jgi:hypothetical protein
MELRELATGRTQSWQRMQSGDFNASATHLILRRRAAAGGGGRGAGAPAAPSAPAAPAGGPNAARGTDAVVHELASGRSLFLGSVGDISFNRQGDLLGYTVDAQIRDGNGLFLIDSGAVALTCSTTTCSSTIACHGATTAIGWLS